jgi:hypothetical protein
MKKLLLISFGVYVFIGGSSLSIAQPTVVAPSKDFTLKNSDLVIRDSANKVRIRLDAQSGDIRVLDDDGKTVVVHVIWCYYPVTQAGKASVMPACILMAATARRAWVDRVLTVSLY